MKIFPSRLTGIRRTTSLLSLGMLFGWVAIFAAPESADLGEGLAYLRVHSLGESKDTIRQAIQTERALVLDVRYATAAADDVAGFAGLLGPRADRAPLLVLVSPETPATLAAGLERLPRGVITLGVTDSRPSPKVIVTQAADVDRRAYDAHDSGMPLESLITGKIDKERYDEASLVREFQNGTPAPNPPPAPDLAAKSPGEKAPVLTDRVLQRAVHLHRALQALRAPAGR